ncbi:MAG: hypothetical protein EA352_09635 [Gemmatimonadales bacterium]|nr:MAG: hypothetical protein EA352_09635 [Gemmatimonadales bacterium]
MAYFQRSGNLALLGVATIFTYGIGGLAYWLVKRKDRVCPACGLSWKQSRPMGPSGLPVHAARHDPQETSSRNGERGTAAALPHAPSLPSPGGSLPPGGMGRRVTGVLTGLFGLFIVAMSLVEGVLAPSAFGGVMILGAALLFGWGWSARRNRRQAVLERTQRQVIHLAHLRGGRLTATDVATMLDMGLPGAERVLLSLDDGFRVRSEVTRDGILVFDFPEVSLADRTRNADVVDWQRALDKGGSSADPSEQTTPAPAPSRTTA